VVSDYHKLLKEKIAIGNRNGHMASKDVRDIIIFD
jgi:hypothetical protein